MNHLRGTAASEASDVIVFSSSPKRPLNYLNHTDHLEAERHITGALLKPFLTHQTLNK